MRLFKLRRDESGVAAIEMALTLPVLISFIYGIMQVGMIMAADAGMQHALGEGARVATLFPTPSDTTIKSKITDRVFGTYVGAYVVTDPVTTEVKNSAGSVTSRYKDLRVTYTVTPDFIFFTGPVVTFDRKKRVYLSF